MALPSWLQCILRPLDVQSLNYKLLFRTLLLTQTRRPSGHSDANAVFRGRSPRSLSLAFLVKKSKIASENVRVEGDPGHRRTAGLSPSGRLALLVPWLARVLKLGWPPPRSQTPRRQLHRIESSFVSYSPRLASCFFEAVSRRAHSLLPTANPSGAFSYLSRRQHCVLPRLYSQRELWVIKYMRRAECRDRSSGALLPSRRR